MTDEIQVKDVVERMKSVLGTKENIALAEYAGVNAGSVSNWSARGTIPWEAMCRMSRDYNVTLDWLAYGGEQVQAISPSEPPELRDPRARRLTAFVHYFATTRQSDELAWLEQHMIRTVPEYAVWKNSQSEG